MGWFWDSKPANSTTSETSGDAYSKLDPGLRDFLEKQTPIDSQSRETARPPQPIQPEPVVASEDGKPYRAQLGLNVPGLNQENQNAPPKDNEATVPPESLYQDGRYAHLWKNYKSQADIQANSQSDQDKLAAVYDTLADRKAAIGRAALENCIEEQMAEKLCYSTGDIKKRLTMCRAENRAFNRCFSMQSRFLKALGYLSAQNRSAEEEEKIQMHADKLYHEMLEREVAIEEARKAGLEKPIFQPLINESTTHALGEDSAWARARRRAQASGLPNTLSEFPAEKQKEIRDRIKDLSESERDVELQLIAAESRAVQEYAERIDHELQEEKRHRESRRERGRETVGDTLKRMSGFGNK